MIKLSAFADEAGNSLEEQINALKENNISLIEIRNVNKKNVSEMTVAEAENIRKSFEENKIKVWSVGSPLGKTDINADFENYKKIIFKTFENAKILGAKNIRIFSFFNAYENDEKVFRNLRYMLDTAKEYSLTLCHENEKDIYGDNLERVLKLHDILPDLKLIYDSANYIQCNENVKQAFINLKDKTYYYHIKDSLYRNGAVVPAGWGDGRISEKSVV